jgi:hypothetical protein
MGVVKSVPWLWGEGQAAAMAIVASTLMSDQPKLCLSSLESLLQQV